MTAPLPDVGYGVPAEPPAGVFLPKRNPQEFRGLTGVHLWHRRCHPSIRPAISARSRLSPFVPAMRDSSARIIAWRAAS